MKCPCPICNGKGYVYNALGDFNEDCGHCQGSGAVIVEPMTNEEWFASLPTEEKARFLDRICYSAWGDRNSRFKDMADYTDWVEWLKEKHE